MQNNPKEARELFRRLYNLFRGKGGHADTFEDHPGWDKPTGADKPTTPWDRLALAAEEWRIKLPGYLFTSLKKLLTEQNTKNFHPHFLLNETMLAEYRKNYPMIAREIEIRWESQKLALDAEIENIRMIPEYEEESDTTLLEKAVVTIACPLSSLFLFDQWSQARYPGRAADELEKARFEYSLFPEVYDRLISDETILKELK